MVRRDGKTYVFKMITGEEEPDSGNIEIGDTVELGYVNQDRPLDPDKSIWEEISAAAQETVQLGNRQSNSRAYTARFNFSGSDQQKLCREISGGERNRVHLAKMLKQEANVLLLDEPTNDLDVHVSLRAWKKPLPELCGAVPWLFISHDRWFLDRVFHCTWLAFEGNSQVYWFHGNYSEYEENREERLGSRYL
ncbi:MAG: ATP-binding cassette domain-containing protein [Fodinibius sp.]|nr:ATP-binding cassette domain-containing protein [Fodinibius sp.]